MFGIAACARPIVLLLLTEKWLPSVPFLRVLCVSGAFAPFYELYRNLAISEGRSDIYMRCNVAQILLLLLLIIRNAVYRHRRRKALERRRQRAAQREERQARQQRAQNRSGHSRDGRP
jgi:hypothetical protein